MKEYDILIIGSGPAGLTAGIYTGRSKYSVGILEEYMIGGQCVDIESIENFPSYKNIKGIDLVTSMYSQCIDYKVKFHIQKVTSIDTLEHIVYTDIDTYRYKKLILATGLTYNKPNIDSIDKFLGRGVSYCAVCDANLYKSKTVAVVGRNATATNDVEYLSHYADKVYHINMSKINENKTKPNILNLSTHELVSVNGDKYVTDIDVSDKNNNVKNIKIDGLFISMGKSPSNKYISNIKLDDKGYIVTDEYMCTSNQDIYAVGDIRNTPLRQIITACSDGAIAATSAIKSLNTNK